MAKSHPSQGLELVNLTLGAALMITPLIARSSAPWNANLTGALIIACSVLALWKYSDWAEGTNVAIGFWTAVAPAVPGLAASAAAIWTHALIGATVATVAGLQLLMSRNQTVSKAGG
ncbi:SPW repeat protein [Leisingera aquaemixtae]|uniref:SPW repeat domain-containing protein n=1 Tax=Leisingera aquaemixtae TaxID=1396826 RepID=UPI0021A3BFA7|nr:SPW repeat protein [Leisingera aquaemixtae]UWQ36900.1 SPW repeat protein [Leisingera aquaemixtae]